MTSILHNLSSSPTRQQSILDLVFTNRVDVVHKVEVAAGLRGSDHDAVYFTTNFHKPRITLQKRWSYNFKKADFKTLHELLNRVPWDSCFLNESVQECWIHFKDFLLSITDQCIPKITLRHRKNQHSAFSGDGSTLEASRPRSSTSIVAVMVQY